VGIHRLLHSSFCFLNINTAITRQLIPTARKLEAEWWQVCGEARVRGQRKMGKVLGAFRLRDFTMLRPVLAWRAFLKLWTVYFFNFPIFFRAAANRGYGSPSVLTSTCMAPIWSRVFSFPTTFCKYFSIPLIATCLRYLSDVNTTLKILGEEHNT
jgi:hypothetical protein